MRHDYITLVIQLGWVPCHHGIARPQVSDGGRGLQIWRVAANILNKQPRTADKGWPSSLGVGQGATTHHRKKRIVCYEMSQRASDLDGCFGTT
jgi:hypothetical protein